MAWIRSRYAFEHEASPGKAPRGHLGSSQRDLLIVAQYESAGLEVERQLRPGGTIETFSFLSYTGLHERKATIRPVILSFGLKGRAICYLLFAIGLKGRMI
jgi:hypothetical protein